MLYMSLTICYIYHIPYAIYVMHLILYMPGTICYIHHAPYAIYDMHYRRHNGYSRNLQALFN